MQRVVRSTFVGLLTLAGLVACGDKVTVTNPTTPVPSKTVRSVTVQPEQLTIAVGGTATLAASVNADEGQTDRTVTWASSNTAIATVDATSGLVRGVAAGVTTVRATSKADPQVSGAAAVTVTGAGGPGLPPTVTISSINQTNAAGQSVPVNVLGAAGQVDVILNVETNGQQLRTVSATLNCPNGTSMTQTQTIAGAVQADVDASAAAAPITVSFNTGLFNTTTGVPTLRNGQCSLTASATTGPTGATQTQTATFTNVFVLANVDGVVLSESFSAFTNAEGIATVTSATDAGGLPWRGGNVTVTALPVLYSGRQIFGGATPGSISITLPGATNPTVTQTPTAAGPVTATYSATATSGSRVTGLTLVDPNYIANGNACAPLPACEVNGVTPLGVTPTVIALDNAGNDIQLAVLNFTQPALNLPNPRFRLDNTPVQAPTTFIIAPRQAGWVSGATQPNFSSGTTPYVFTGVGEDGGLTAPNGTAKYVSCGDGPAAASGAAYDCIAQIGVSRAAVDEDDGINGLTTFSYYAIPTASYTPASATNGTSTSATSCSISGSWQKIDNAAALAATLANTAYVVRVFEKDRLGNARCTDLAAAADNINDGGFARGTFGVDNLPPTANYIEPSADPTAAANNGALAIGGNIANFNVKIGLSDDASGFSGLPVLTNVRRFAINPATNAPGSFNSAFGCPIGRAGNGNCTAMTPSSQTLPGNAGVATVDGVNGSGCAGCGYYLFAQTPNDLARNLSPTVGGTVAPTISTGPGTTPAPAGFRQVVVDQQAPTVGGIAVPASITGGASAAFATSAADNLDLVSSNYTLTYSAQPAGTATPFSIRTPGPAIGVAFDNTLTNASSFSVNVPFFIRSIATTTAAGAPQNNGAAGRPSAIGVRAYDAANNASAPGTSAINPANVPYNNPTDFTAAPAGANPAATMFNFQVANSAINVSNCPAAGCAGGVAPANPTTVTLAATSVGAEGPTFQFINPFTQVQFYYFDTTVNEWVLIGSAVAPVVTDNATVTQRTFTWTLATPFDPPAALGAGVPLQVIAVGVNAAGDALASAVNGNINLTNP